MLGGSHPDAGCLNCGDGAVLSPMGWWSTVTTLWLEEDVPAGADLGRTTGEPAEPVAAVDVQVPGEGLGQDVGLAVAGEVTGREHPGEDVPSGADLGRATGEPAKPVAVVQVQVPGEGLGQEVGLAVAGEVTGREHPGEDVPSGADLGRATGEPAKPVAVVQVHVPGAGLGQEVGLAVAGEVTGREHLVEDVPSGADLGRATGEPAKPVAVVQVQVPGAGLGQDVGLAVAGEVAG